MKTVGLKPVRVQEVAGEMMVLRSLMCLRLRRLELQMKVQYYW